MTFMLTKKNIHITEVAANKLHIICKHNTVTVKNF